MLGAVPERQAIENVQLHEPFDAKHTGRPALRHRGAEVPEPVLRGAVGGDCAVVDRQERCRLRLPAVVQRGRHQRRSRRPRQVRKEPISYFIWL